MSNYISHNTKKIKVFHKKRDHLKRLVSRKVETEKLLEVAEECRLAKIRALKTEYLRAPRFDSKEDLREWARHIEAKILDFEKMSAEAALIEFG